MCRFLMFVVTLLISVGESSATSQKKVIDSTLRSAEKNSQMAINFHQGNHDSLIDAQGYFTPDGWNKFISSLSGFLDEEGAPNFTQSYSRSGESLDVRRENGMLYFTLPGILEQESTNKYGGLSKAKYLIEIYVQVHEATGKIVFMKNSTCSASKGKESCR